MGFHPHLQQDGRLVGVLPGDVNQTVVRAVAGGVELHLGGGEGEAEARLDEEADGVALVGSRASVAFVLLRERLDARLAIALVIKVFDEEVAAQGHLAGDEVIGGIAELSLLPLGTQVEGEGSHDGLIGEGHLLLRGFLQHGERKEVVVVVGRGDGHVACLGIEGRSLVLGGGIVLRVRNLGAIADGVVGVAGIALHGDDVAGILHGNLEHGTLAHLDIIAVVAETGAVGLDGHQHAVVLNGFHGARLGRT